MSEYKNTNEESLTGNLDFNKIAGKLYIYKYIILLCTLVGLLAGWMQNRYTRPTYAISASLLAKGGDKTAAAAGILSGAALLRDNKTIEDEVSIIKSYPFMSEVVRELDLGVSYFSRGRFIDVELYKRSPFRVELTSCSQIPEGEFFLRLWPDSTYSLSGDKDDELSGKYKIGQEIALSTTCACKVFFTKLPDRISFDTRYIFRFNDIEKLANYYVNAISIRNLNGSLLNLSITSSVAQREEDLLNLLMEKYIDYTLQLKNETFIKTIEFIDLQLSQVADSLNNVETRLERLKQDRNISMSSKKDGTESMMQIFTLEEEKMRMQLGEKYIDYLETYINQSEDYEKIATPNMANVDNPILSGLISELISLQMEKNTYLKNAKERNPFVEELNAKMKNLRQALIEAIATTRSINKITLQNIDSRIAVLRKEARNMPSTEREMVGINRLYTINEGIYLTLLQKRLEADVSRAAATVDSKVVQPAFTAARLGPNEIRNYGIGAFTGFLIPVLFIFVKEFFRGTIETTDELERISPVTLFGTVLHDQNKKGEAVTIVQRPKSALAESFRSLRSNLSFVLGGGTEPKVLLVTSSIPGEGKSFCSTNLSVILSLSGKRVVHIVADLRKPKVYIELDEMAQADDAGLSNYLSATA
jgi:uncharacterized protein involved in exopolysaccharide biosynthesis